MTPTIVSYYTLDTPYQYEVLHLIESCKKFNLSTHIKGIPSKGQWELNCAQKPYFLLSTLRHLQKPLLWVDADAAFVNQPDFSFLTDCDISVRIDKNLSFPLGVYSGTIYIDYTPSSLSLLEKWIQAIEAKIELAHHFELAFGVPKNYTMTHPAFWDQIILNEVLHENPGIRVHPLPIPYCKVFDEDASCHAIIEHRQASRRFKDSV